MSSLPARLSLFLLLLCIGLMPLPVRAEDAPARTWSVEEISGTVSVEDASGREMARVRPGTALTPPFTARTGDDGRLVLGHGRDRVTVSSGARFQIPEPQPAAGGLIDRVRQALGSMLYEIEHRMTGGGFEVETPYLVSVVKGTTFNILVTADASTVALIEGRLAVHTLDGKSQVMLEPGQAAIKSRDGDRILLKDPQALTTPMTGPIRIVGGAGSAGETGGIDPGIASMNVGSASSVAIGGATAELAVGAAPAGVDAALRLDTGSGIEVGGAGVNVGATTVSLDVGAPGVDVGTVSVGVGQASIDLGATPQVDVGGVSIDVGGTTVGDIAGIGGTSIDLGDIVIGGDAGPVIDLGDTSVDIGEVTVGDLSTPGIGLDVSLDVDASAGGAGAAVDLDLGGTPVVDLGVTGTEVSVDVAPEEIVGAVTNIVSGVTNTTGNLLNNLPGL